MKKILFCLQTMVCGGVEKELITILNRFNPQEYDLAVLLFYTQDKEMEKKLPNYVEFINLQLDKKYYCGNLKNVIAERMKKGEMIEAAKIITSRIVKGISVPVNISLDKINILGEKYDYAVCYHMHSPLVLKYVAEKVQAKRKYAWIHNDFITTGFPIAQYDAWLQNYNAFFGVSEQITSEFRNICSNCSNRAFTLPNIVDEKEILLKAEDFSSLDRGFETDKNFRIVTVGRFVEQKGFDLAIKATSILKKQGLKFTWYAIGYGKDETLMKSLIDENDVSDCFIILGRKENPYPYIKMSDIYVQPSRHEGYAITIEEAKVLKKVIVCTNFSGASEQLINKETGIIVDAFSAERIAEAISPFILNSNYKNNFQCKINNTAYKDNWDAIQEVFT
ncbi:glycosyltransferase [Faecalicatena sp. Marseille-Q4148]|nr:glycosyltransferase [Faecalicatena sp. Marseille-Q4148]